MAKKNFFAEAKKLASNPGAYSVRYRLTVTELNPKALEVVPAGSGKARLLDAAVIATGAAVTGATSLVISGTQGGASKALMTVPIANMTRSAINGPSTAGVVLLADGDSFAPCDKGTPITFWRTGAVLVGTTIDIVLTYAID